MSDHTREDIAREEHEALEGATIAYAFTELAEHFS